MGRACVKIREGSGFFAAEDYILTCRHVFEDRGKLVLDEKAVPYLFENNEYMAEVKAIDEEHDLVLLHAVTAPADHSYKELDRIANYNTPVIVKGFPNNEDILRPVPAKVGKENGNGKIALYEANGTSQGDSGGPVCPETEEDRVVGIFHFIMGRDKDGRQVEMSGMIPASVALELWGEYVEEARFSLIPDDRKPFAYYSEKTDFIDPEKNLEKLKAFAEDDEPVLWWAVVAEGGSGKSRLAYEFLHSLSSEWYCAILDPDKLKTRALDNMYFDAGRDVFIVADYAYSRTGDLNYWLSKAKAGQKNKSYPHKIRVLLLQRHDEYDNRSPSFFAERFYVGNHELRGIFYTGKALMLQQLGNYELMELMRSYAARHESKTILDDTTCEKLYGALESVDKDLTRPLFAMFITDAFLDGEPYKTWKPEEALDYFVDREQGFLDKVFSDKDNNIEIDKALVARRLWVLATITRGFRFSKETLPEVILRRGVDVSSSDLGVALEDAHYVDTEPDAWIMKPMTPDILGEYFVLRYFQEHQYDIQSFLEEAYKASPDNTGDFLTRMFADHPTDIDMIKACRGQTYSFDYSVSRGLAFRGDLKNLETMYEEDEGEWWLVNYATGLVHHLVDHEGPEKVEEVLERLKELHEKHPDNAKVVGLYANGLIIHIINLIINCLAYQEDSDKSYEILGWLKELSEQHPDNIETVEVYAEGLSYQLLHQVNQEKAEEILEQLEELYEKHPDNDRVMMAYVSTIFNCLHDQINQEKAEDGLARLKDLHEKHPDDPRVMETYASYLAHRVLRQINQEKAEDGLARLKDLHEKHPDNIATVEAYTRGLADSLIYKKEPEKVEEVLERLKELYEKHPDDAQIAASYAEGFVNSLIYQKDLEKVEEVLERLKELYEKHRDNARVVNQYARGRYIKLLYQPDIDKAEIELVKLEEIFNTNVDKVVEVYAEGLFIYLERLKGSKKTGVVLERLNRLSEQYSDNDKVTTIYGQALQLFNSNDD